MWTSCQMRSFIAMLNYCNSLQFDGGQTPDVPMPLHGSCLRPAWLHDRSHLALIQVPSRSWVWMMTLYVSIMSRLIIDVFPHHTLRIDAAKRIAIVTEINIRNERPQYSVVPTDFPGTCFTWPEFLCTIKSSHAAMATIVWRVRVIFGVIVRENKLLWSNYDPDLSLTITLNVIIIIIIRQPQCPWLGEGLSMPSPC